MSYLWKYYLADRLNVGDYGVVRNILRANSSYDILELDDLVFQIPIQEDDIEAANFYLKYLRKFLKFIC